MANLFSLQDGLLTDASVYGYSLSSAEVMSNTTGVYLSTVDAYGPIFTGDGSTISAVAVHLSGRQSNNTTDSLVLKLSAAGKSVQTEYYPISNFTAYDASNNLLASYPLNWQILKLSTGYQIPNLSSARISLAATTSGVISLIGVSANNNFDKAVIASTATTPLLADTIHLGGSIKLSATEVRTIVANTSSYQNLYIHNQGVLTFPLTASKTLTLNGSAGLQITSNGTVNIGTSSSVIPLSTTHTINLSNTQIDVHNGGNLNVYGYPKLFTTNLINDTVSGSRTFITTDSISASWLSGDTIGFKPNLSFKRGFDILALSSFAAANSFTTTTSSTYVHTGSATYANIAGVYNLTRNVIIQGLNSANRATIRTIDAANTKINYAQLNNFGINASNKTGFVFGNNLNGSTVLSGILISSDNTSTVNNIAPLTGRAFQNTTINDSIIYKSNIISIASLSVNNVFITNNYILSSGNIALQMNNLSGSISMSNNTTIASLSYGTYLYNNVLTGAYGANNFNSGLQGMMISGTNTGTIIGGGLNSSNEGVYVNASTSNLSSVIFQNILADNNSSVGFKVSGNNLNYLTPVTLNINGLSANTNSDAGFEAYNITGNISSVVLSNNSIANLRTSIGNGITIFDTLSSTISDIPTPNVTLTTVGTPVLSTVNGIKCIGFLNASNYYTCAVADLYRDQDLITTSTFTMEAWVYPIARSNTGSRQWPTLINGANFGFGIDPAGKLRWEFYRGGNNGQRAISGTTTVSLNAWSHIAICMNNGSLSFFVNGIKDTLATSDAYGATLFTTQENAYNTATPNGAPGTFNAIGVNFTGLAGNYDSCYCYVSYLRVCKTTALYSTNFTPTYDFSNTNGTFLLINAGSAYNTGNILNTSKQNISILSATNYNQTIFKNFNVYTKIINTIPSIKISFDKFEDFRIESSNLSSENTFYNTNNIYYPLSLSSTRSTIEGSYTFHNSNSDIYGLSSLALTGYQTDIFRDGIVVMRENGLSGNHYKYNAAGSISLDTVVVNSPNTVSERLTPWSSTIKLRSTSKMIPVNKGDSIQVSVILQRSTGYNGTAPRLMMVGNASLGYEDTVLTTSSQVSGWETLQSAQLSAATNTGIIEFYVDCSGNVGAGSINIDSWNFI